MRSRGGALASELAGGDDPDADADAVCSPESDEATVELSGILELLEENVDQKSS